MPCHQENDITPITTDVAAESSLGEVVGVLILGDVEMVVRAPTKKHLRHPKIKNYGPLSRLQRRMTENSDSFLECERSISPAVCPDSTSDDVCLTAGIN